MATIETNDCAVCCEPFNKTTVPVACEHSGMCAFVACNACIKTYLVGTSTDPNCMQCNKAWSDKFLMKQLGTTYMKGEYITHRKELLVQQQLARLPETMAAADQYKRIRMVTVHVEELHHQFRIALKEGKALTKSIHAINREITTVLDDDESPIDSQTRGQLRGQYNTNKQVLKTELDANTQIKALLQSTIHKLQRDIAVIIQNGDQPVEAELEKTAEARKFIMPCPNIDCRGYLSTQYKCDLCEFHTCAKCFDLIGRNKEDTGHLCKPENVDSAEFIRKQSKPCPCCYTRISKIDGCDQMWCTQCRKAFSWNTGKIVTGTIHNPHFYQYQREHGGGFTPRNPGDIVCGGLPGFRDINEKMILCKVHKSNPVLFNTLTNIHRLQGHFTQFDVQPLRTALQVEQNFELERVQYIVQEINREELAGKIFRKDKSRKIKIAVLHLCELFIAVGTDMFQKILLSEQPGVKFEEEIIARVSEYEQLRQYCNEHFKELSILYSVCVPEIKANWATGTTKYNTKGETDNYILKRDEQRRVRQEMRDKQWQDYMAKQAETRRQRVQLQQQQAQVQQAQALVALEQLKL